jgi:hypothetical protein
MASGLRGIRPDISAELEKGSNGRSLTGRQFREERGRPQDSGQRWVNVWAQVIIDMRSA